LQDAEQGSSKGPAEGQIQRVKDLIQDSSKDVSQDSSKGAAQV